MQTEVTERRSESWQIAARILNNHLESVLYTKAEDTKSYD